MHERGSLVQDEGSQRVTTMEFDLNMEAENLPGPGGTAAHVGVQGPVIGRGDGVPDLNMEPPPEHDEVQEVNQPTVEMRDAIPDLNVQQVEGEDDILDLTLEPQEEENIDENYEENYGAGEQMLRENAGKRQILSDKQRDVVYKALLALSKKGKLGNSNTTYVATKYGVNIWTVQRIWKEAKKQQRAGLEVDVSLKKKNRVGRKKKDIDFSQVPLLPLCKRRTLRALSKRLHVSVTTLHRRFKIGMLRRHSSSLKPYLKDSNKLDRLRFCCSMLDRSTLCTADPKFNDMQNIIHIDEKWFYMTKKNKTFYLVPEEEDPHRTIQNKNSIGKVMFLAVLAKPQYDEHGNETFSGKIGVFPFVIEEPAARNSKHRPKGTLIKKSVVVNRDVMRDYMINKVLPAIQAKWPNQHDGKPIFIQQDNARTHLSPSDPAFCEAVAATGLDIQLMHQPANSPDMNILDLGFFSSIQSLTDDCSPRTLDDLIQDVEREFDGYDVSLVKKVFLTLQACMIETMKCDGGNRYKQPHLHKDALERTGALSSRLSCDKSLVEKVRQILESTP